MSLDLTLLPVDHDGKLGHAHSMLDCDAGGGIYDAMARLGISEKRLTDPPDDFFTFRATGADGEPRYGRTTETPYGEPIRCARIRDLLRLTEEPVITESRKNRAVWAWLRAMPPDTKVALYWH